MRLLPKEKRKQEPVSWRKQHRSQQLEGRLDPATRVGLFSGTHAGWSRRPSSGRLGWGPAMSHMVTAGERQEPSRRPCTRRAWLAVKGPRRPPHFLQHSLPQASRPDPALHPEKSLPLARPAASYLKECENGRALEGGSRRGRNAVLGKGGQGPPQPLTQVLGGHAGTPPP